MFVSHRLPQLSLPRSSDLWGISGAMQTYKKGRFDGDGPTTSPMIKSAKIRREGRRKFNQFGLITSHRGDPPDLQRVVWRIPHFSSGKNLHFFRNESFLSLSKTNSSLSRIVLHFFRIISPRSKKFGSWKIR